MSHLRVACAYGFDEGAEGWMAEIANDYPQLRQVRDLVSVANIPPTPNLTVVSAEQAAGQNLLSQLASDPKYGEGSILLTHDDEGTYPSQILFDATRNYLISRGMTTAQVDAAIGTTPRDRTRFAISNDLIAWLKAN